MLVAGSVVGIEVSGDGSIEGIALAFDDDEPMERALFMTPENDHDRLTYI
jgi:hypothetical protein